MFKFHWNLSVFLFKNLQMLLSWADINISDCIHSLYREKLCGRFRTQKNRFKNLTLKPYYIFMNTIQLAVWHQVVSATDPESRVFFLLSVRDCVLSLYRFLKTSSGAFWNISKRIINVTLCQKQHIFTSLKSSWKKHHHSHKLRIFFQDSALVVKPLS